MLPAFEVSMLNRVADLAPVLIACNPGTLNDVCLLFAGPGGHGNSQGHQRFVRVASELKMGSRGDRQGNAR